MSIQTRIVQLPDGRYRVETRKMCWLDFMWSRYDDIVFGTVEEAREHAKMIRMHCSKHDAAVRVVE